MAKVSVVIPTYRRAGLLLDRALPSVFIQDTDMDIEIIVVGDGTDDETVYGMVDLIENSDRDISFKNLPRQQYTGDPQTDWCILGLEARNYGYERATGDFLVGLDDDDALLPHMIRVLHKALVDGSVDVAYGRSLAFNSENKHVASYGRWPPMHFAFCVTGDMEIDASDVLSGYRRRYKGPILTVKTARGKEFSCTPNHPVASRHGWVPAKLLKVGDDVVSGGFIERASDGFPNVDDMPITAEQLFEALQELGITERAPLGPLDFHGDGTIDGEVEIVTTHRKLLTHETTSLSQPSAQEFFAIADNGDGSRPSRGLLGESFMGRMRRQSITSSLGRLAPLFRGPVLAYTFGSFAGVSDRHALAYDPTLDRVARALMLGGQDVGRYPVKVTSDDIIEISTREMDKGGHVYNFETSLGCYFTGGIVTHNCEGAWLAKHDLGYRLDPACVERGLPEDGDKIDRMIADGVKFTFVNEVVHHYYPNERGVA